MVSKHEMLLDNETEWKKGNLMKEKMKSMDDKEMKFNLNVISLS